VTHYSRLVLACVITLSRTCLSQDLPASAVTASAIAGATLPDDPLKFAMLEVRAQAFSHVSLAVAAAYLEGPRGYEEAQLRLSATWAYQGGPWTMENRHLLAIGEAAERYRCRLRLIRSVGQGSFSVRTFDELYVDLDHGLVRNNLALGVGAKIGAAVTAELYHVWVDNHDARNDNYVLVFLTLRL